MTTFSQDPNNYFTKEKVYIALGANLGDPFTTFFEVRRKIERLEGIENVRASRLFQTAPISDIPQNDYINAVLSFDCALSLQDLYSKLVDIENALGKEKKSRENHIINAPRIIDIDILLFGDKVIDTVELTVPHPRMAARAFVLCPLRDLLHEQVIAFPTREGFIMIHLDNLIQKLQEDPRQRIVPLKRSEWECC